MAKQMNKELSARFLNAFCAIEDELRRRCGGSNRDSFSYMLDHLSKSQPAVNHYRDDLKEYSELRNAIVHRRIGDEPIAEPHPEVVSQIEFIAEALLSPPLLEIRFLKPVRYCSDHDSIRDVVMTMSEGQYNQLPVYSDGILVGLVSADIVTRWLGEAFQRAAAVDGQEQIRDVLRLGGKHDFELLSRRATVFDALHVLESNYKKGRRVKAIIITESGEYSEKPIGIVTTLDLPELYMLINPDPAVPIRRRK